MTKEEKEIALHCLRAMIDEEVCEECDIYGKTGTDHCEADTIRMVIKELEKASSSEIPNKSEIPTSSNNLSSGTRKKLEKGTPKDRVCKNCKHFVKSNEGHTEALFGEIYSCEKWECEFEPLEPTQSPIIDWNNCHTPEQLESMSEAIIKNTPELVDFMLDESVTADSRMKLRKRLEELCKLSLKALEQELRWIPVSERLPEDHKDVLVYLSSDRMSICRYNSHKLPSSNNPIGWGYMPGIGYIDFEKEHVMAWMHLPEPYKAESEDRE